MKETPEQTARKVRQIVRKVRELDNAINWIYFVLGMGTAFVVAVGCCLAAIKMLRDAGL